MKTTIILESVSLEIEYSFRGQDINTDLENMEIEKLRKTLLDTWDKGTKEVGLTPRKKKEEDG